MLKTQRKHAQEHEAHCLLANSSQVDSKHRERLAEIFHEHCPSILLELRSQTVRASINFYSNGESAVHIWTTHS